MSVISRIKELAGFGVVPGQSNTVPYGSADGQPFLTSAKLRKALNNAHRNPVVCSGHQLGNRPVLNDAVDSVPA